MSFNDIFYSPHLNSFEELLAKVWNKYFSLTSILVMMLFLLSFFFVKKQLFKWLLISSLALISLICSVYTVKATMYKSEISGEVFSSDKIGISGFVLIFNLIFFVISLFLLLVEIYKIQREIIKKK